MRKISAVGLFCCDKFEETPKQKVIDRPFRKRDWSIKLGSDARNDLSCAASHFNWRTVRGVLQ